MPNMEDYDLTYGSFGLDVPDRYNFAIDVIDRLGRDPERLAMWHLNADGRDSKITFAQMAERSRMLASGMRAAGIKPQDKVMVILPRVPQWWECMLALMRCGAVAVPGTTQLTSKDILFRARAAEVKAIIADQTVAQRASEVVDECPDLRLKLIVDGEQPGWTDLERLGDLIPASLPESPTASSDPALLYFTSGTVGYPKMVLHTHASYPIGHCITGRFWLDLGANDLHWNLSDNGWAKAAWSSLFGPWSQGAALFVQDARGKFDPSQTLDILGNYPITTFCAPPTAYRVLVTQELDPAGWSLRHCVSAGEPLNPEVITTWQQDTGMTIRDGYGQTETVLLCANFPCLELRPGSMGKPSPTFELAIISEDGQPVPDGREGDIAVRVRPQRPVAMFTEYWKNPEETASSQRGDWYITKDRAIRDSDGYFWFVGRADDVIISAGYRIGPFEVESALVEHPAVVEAAVIGVPESTRGQVVKAYIILAADQQPSDQLKARLQEHVRSVTAPYKYPREIEFVTELPKTVSGKIRRSALRSGWRPGMPSDMGAEAQL